MPAAGGVSVQLTRSQARATVSLLHPDVAVVLSDSGLRVQERQPHTALGTQAGIVVTAMFDGFPVELLSQPLVMLHMLLFLMDTLVQLDSYGREW